MADARPFHWEFKPEPVAPRGLPDRGRPAARRARSAISGAKNAALKLLAAATLTGERCRFTNVPEIEDVRVMAETLRDLGVVVDHPAPNVYEVASGDVDWLFVPLEAAAKMRASFILLGPLLARFGRVIISNPGGDRIGRRPVNLHVDAMRALGAEIEYRNGYYFAQAPGPAARRRRHLPARLGHGHRERDAGRGPGRRPHDHPAGGPGAGGRRPDRVPAEDGRRGRADRPGHDRDRGPQAAARRRPPGRPRPDRGRHVRRRGRRDRRPGHPRGRALRPPRARSSTSLGRDRRGRQLRRRHDRGRRRAARPSGATAPCDIETAPYPGLATDLQPPTCVLLTQASGREPRPRDDLRGPPGVAGRAAPDGRRGRASRTPHHAIDQRPVTRSTAPSVEIGDLRAGASLILAALAADGTTLDPRRAPRPPGV